SLLPTIPRPPPSTLFPYTTLFRSLHRITEGRDQIAIDGIAPLLKIAGDFLFERQSVQLEVEKLSFKTSFRRSGSRSLRPQAMKRSEEHTSELQSRFDLVCRLLLEK